MQCCATIDALCAIVHDSCWCWRNCTRSTSPWRQAAVAAQQMVPDKWSVWPSTQHHCTAASTDWDRSICSMSHSSLSLFLSPLLLLSVGMADCCVACRCHGSLDLPSCSRPRTSAGCCCESAPLWASRELTVWTNLSSHLSPQCLQCYNRP